MQNPTTTTITLTPQPSPARSTTSTLDSILPTPSTSPWASPKAFSGDHPRRRTSSVLKHHCKILSLSLSSNQLVYVGTESKTIRVWMLPGLTKVDKLRSGSGHVDAVVVSDQHGLVFSAHADRKIRVWLSNPVHSRKGTLPYLKNALIKVIFSKGSGGDGSSEHKLKHSGSITSLAYDPSTGLLYSGSLDNTVKVWMVKEMKCVETIYAHNDSINTIAIGPDGLLFTGSDDTTIKTWRKTPSNSHYHTLLFSLHQSRSPVKAIVVAGGDTRRDDYVVYGGCSDGNLHYWKKRRDVIGMGYLGSVRGGHDHGGCGGGVVCLAAAGRVVVSGLEDGSVRVWRRSGGGLLHQCTAVLGGHTGAVKAVAARVEGEGCVVYSGGVDGCVKQWWVREESGEDEIEGSLEDYFEISSPLVFGVGVQEKQGRV